MNWLLEFHEHGQGPTHDSFILRKHYMVVKADTSDGAWHLARGIQDQIAGYTARSVVRIAPRELEPPP